MRGKRTWKVNIQRATNFDFVKRKYMVNVIATQSVQINKLFRKENFSLCKWMMMIENIK